jgi:hypothetical protein
VHHEKTGALDRSAILLMPRLRPSSAGNGQAALAKAGIVNQALGMFVA